jgi:hypothetical protein
MKKQFKLNAAVSATANRARLRSHVIRTMKNCHTPMSRLGRCIAHCRLNRRVRRGIRMR